MPMQWPNVTYQGPALDNAAPILQRLPVELVALLRDENGFVALGGGLHLRGVCEQPLWHSLAAVLDGPRALHKLYPSVAESDVPFAQDCLADQFLLRESAVVRLSAETGDLTPLAADLAEFLSAAQSDPVEFLGLHPLMQFGREGGRLQPGQVLNAYPPFCTAQAGDGVSLRAVPVDEALAYLPELAKHMSGLADGQPFRMTWGA
jgi:hypothetical protein